jgi:HAD superfamily hydrolase (TIGR01490 family)
MASGGTVEIHAAALQAPRLALFDLDHTLLDGDSDVLWCDFLIDIGRLDRTVFGERNAAMESAYRAGTVGMAEFCAFYVGTLAGGTAADWQPTRERFFAERVLPRLHAGCAALLDHHRRRGDLMVLTTATNRVITELTARHLGIEHLLATECSCDAEGRYDGGIAGMPNMRAGKVERLQGWLAERGLGTLDAFESWFYSDSINDLPLLDAVTHPVVVHADARLAAVAAARGWPERSLRGA